MLLIKPYLGCNLRCLYCYESKYRKKKKPKLDYNLDTILKRMEEFKNSLPQMCLHGGEPLVMPKEDVKKIFSKMKELTGKSSIQTNGSLIDDEYIKIFKEYDTSVGLSYDGPDELSGYRPGTKNLDKKIEKLIKEGLKVSLIMVISKANAGTKQRLKKLKNYLLELDKMKICGRLNPCGGWPEYELDEKRLIEVYLDLADFCFHRNLKWSPFVDIINGLQGKPRVCTFMGCDPFSTPSATVIVGDGSVTNCMRTNEKGILLRYPIKHNTRDQILSQISQEFGGCQNCRYWSTCHGGCPTMAINGDWRNRTYLCPLWKALFQFYEKALSHCGIPVALYNVGEKSVENKPGLGHGDSPHGDSAHGDWPNHGDHTDLSHGDFSPGPPSPQLEKDLKETKPDQRHGDSPHGDWPNHGDSGKNQ
ncbi:hypothetical protein COT20_01055 [bacterium (Candidatus Gribaldobacteria) CG08_land_8_20_14_0_20_39_15]|uniref:Radical SAM core domain-containing protein n=1 Tax=bacterium (Candidatus Gribaldobacteria) CG08_land_8_20_14_0_20_39_15 TaxID=2014273 RepID=A0A2M6XUS6_9BACT|nr:MAG: hypothetical protein COT20_01055 [bacterium (Candidatus Gribaldobacteria) CG08_land_8_20_14_0_20_39_15]